MINGKNFNKIIKRFKNKGFTYKYIIDDKETKRIINLFNDFKYNLLIMSYDIFSYKNKAYKISEMDALIMDEGHKLKNNKTIIYNKISWINCKIKIIVTGTPFQNNLNELYYCFDLVNPKCWGDYKYFKLKYIEPLKIYMENINEEINYNSSIKWMNEINENINKFLIRREINILENVLPKREEIIILIKLDENQNKIFNFYNKYILLDELTKKKISFFKYMHFLKKWCFLPSFYYYFGKNYKINKLKLYNEETYVNYMFIKIFNLDEEVKKKKKKINYIEFKWNIKIKKKEETIEDVEIKKKEIEFLLKDSNKINIIFQIINNHKDDKILIASYSKKILNIIGYLLNLWEIKFLKLDGDLSKKKRGKLVDTFNNDYKFKIFLLASKAGGAGLNLQIANILIMVEPDWNPSNEEQVMGRIYRVGQKKNVKIYRLIYKNTLEEKIFCIQKSKKNISEIIIDNYSSDLESNNLRIKSILNNKDFKIKNINNNKIQYPSINNEFIKYFYKF